MSLWLSQGCLWSHRSHLTTCLWMVCALIQTGHVNLPQWLSYIPCRGLYAQSKQRRVRRWLGNSRINIHRLYKPLVQSALSHWQQSTIYLRLDTSLFWDEYCLIRIAVVHRGRALPLAWRVLAHPSASVAFGAYEYLLLQASRCLPPGVKVVLLADRGFIHTDAMDFVRKHLNWHYRIRLKSDTWIWRVGKGWHQLHEGIIEGSILLAKVLQIQLQVCYRVINATKFCRLYRA